MPSQSAKRLLSQWDRFSVLSVFSSSFPQTIFSDVSGVPVPIGVMGTVAQYKPNTQPEETE
jgi:hypothetical protein